MGSSDSTESKPWQPYGRLLTGEHKPGQYNPGMGLYPEAIEDYQRDRRFFPDSTVGSRSGASLGASDRGFEMGRDPSPYATSSGRYLEDVMGGQYLDPSTNPYLQQVGDAAAADMNRNFARNILPGIGMNAQGRAGSPAEQQRMSTAYGELGDSMGQMYSNLYGGAYAQERGLQQGAAGMMPGIDAARRADAMGALTVGSQDDVYNQRLVDDLRARYEYGRDNKSERLQTLAGMAGGTQPGGGYGQTTQSQGFGASEGIGAGIGLLGLMMMCSKEFKVHLDEPDPTEVLTLVAHLPIAVWRYKEEVNPHDQAEHIGPYAEDVQELFGIGDGKQIHLIDLLGISLAATKGLVTEVLALKQRVTQLESVDEIPQIEVVAG